MIPVTGIWRPGKIVSNMYEVVRELGRGGMGSVYLLRERNTGRPAAVKLPHEKLIRDREQRLAFIREAKVWTQLSVHPNIVRARDVREVDYIPCIFMDFVDGGSVKDLLIAASGTLPLEDAFRIAIQASWAMAFTHASGTVHRDLKPANLLRTKSNVIKISDFGLAREVIVDENAAGMDAGRKGAGPPEVRAGDAERGRPARQMVAGTWPYMAPEQWFGDASPPVDIYAFGIILCELFCGTRPLEPRTHPKFSDVDFSRGARAVHYRLLHRDCEPTDPASLREDIPAGIRRLILQCLSKKPDSRPESFDAIADALDTEYQVAFRRRSPLDRPGQLELNRREKGERAWTLLRLGSSCQFRGDTREAMSLYRQSEALFEESGDREGIATCYNNMGQALREQGAYDAALAMSWKSLAILEDLGTTAALAACCNTIGAILRDRGDYSDALRIHRRALLVCEAVDDQGGMAQGCILVGRILRDAGDSDGALRMYSRGLAICEKLGDRAGMSQCHNHIGMVMHDRGDLDEAMKTYQKSLMLCEELGDRAGMARCFNNVGMVLQEKGKQEAAIRLYRKSLSISEELGDRAGIIHCIMNIGRIMRERGDDDAALNIYRKSLIIHRELGDRAGMSACYLNMGEIYETMGDLRMALETYSSSLELKRTSGLPVPDELLQKISALELSAR